MAEYEGPLLTTHVESESRHPWTTCYPRGELGIDFLETSARSRANTK